MRCSGVLCCGVLCCAVLCCAVLCCAVLFGQPRASQCTLKLGCAVLRCAALCCAVLCCAVLCCAVLCCAVLHSFLQLLVLDCCALCRGCNKEREAYHACCTYPSLVFACTVSVFLGFLLCQLWNLSATPAMWSREVQQWQWFGDRAAIFGCHMTGLPQSLPL